MRQRARTLIIAQMLILSTVACSTKGKVAVDPTKPPSAALDQIALQTSHVEEGIRALTDAKRVLLKDGKITPAQSNAITKALLKVAIPAKELNARAATYDTFSGTARAELFKLFGDLSGAYQSLASQGLYPHNQAVDSALSIINAAIGLLGGVFQ